MIRVLARSLSHAGIETHVATTNDNGNGGIAVACDVPILEEGVTYRYFRRQLRFYTFSWPLSRWLAKHVGDYDLVHIHALFSFATVAAAFWANRASVPYVIRPLGTLNRWGIQHRRPLLKRLSFRLIESRILRNAEFIHYTCEHERIQAAELGVASRAEIIPNALDDMLQTCTSGHFRERYPQLKHRLIILFISRFDAVKGLDLLLPAFASVVAQCPKAMLVLAGSGERGFVRALEQEISRLGISPNVMWAGFLAGKDKQAVLTDADVFVLPSYSENFGIAVVEAMAAGLPVVISDQVGIHREVTGAKAGLVIPCEVERLSQGLLELLRDPEQRSLLGQNGKRLVNEKYSLEAVTAQLIGLYEDVVAEKSPKMASVNF